MKVEQREKIRGGLLNVDIDRIQPRNRRQKKTNTGYRHQSVTPLVRKNLWHSGTILSHANERTISPNMQFCFLKNH